MLKQLLTGSSALVLLLAGSLSVQAEAPQPGSQPPQVQEAPQQGVSLPVSSQELQKFARSLKKLQVIEREAGKEMTRAVQGEGLSEKRFIELYQTRQNSQAQPSREITTQERQKFERALARVGEIEKKTQFKMQQAVQSEGLEAERFAQILAAVQRDPALQQQMQRLMQQSSLLNKYSATDAVPVLQVGSTGQPVEDVQRFLKRAGLYTGAIDGAFGPESKAAVVRFQEQANLTPDGIVGSETWKAMIDLQLG